MKSAKRVSKILFGVSVLMSIFVTAVPLTAQYHPPAYHPPPAPAYHPPAPAYHPPAPAYHPPAPAYHPPAPAFHPPAPPPSRPSYNPPPSQPSSPQNGGGVRPSNPNPPATTHTYTPGVYPNGNTTSPRNPPNGTTYTPHVYTPGSSSDAHPSGSTSVSGEGVRTSNGVTTYTPHAPTGASYTPAAPPTSHANTFTPAAPPAGENSYAPRNLSPTSVSSEATHAVYNVPASATIGKPGAGNSTLGPVGSQSVLHQVNTARTGMTGINKRSIPPGQVAVHPDKSLTVTATNGRQFNLRPNGTLASFSAHGQSASFRADGHLASVHTPTMDIAHGPHGQRTVVSVRPDHSRLVSTGAHNGYLERPVTFNGHSYMQRTYVTGGQSFTRAYVGYHYHGGIFYNYLPFYFYDPLFYGWAYYPWGDAMPFGWGWMGSPWFDFYAGYFSPWGTYPSGAYWLTDYLIGQTLQAAYQMDDQAVGGDPDNGYAGNNGAPGDDEAYAPVDTPLTPEIKQMIAEEVQQQLAYENAAAAKPDEAPALDGLPQVLTANHLFVASQALNVTTVDGHQCTLSAGDTIRLVATPPDDATTANLMVVSSRKADCPAGVTVSVPLESLQEMQNNFRAQLDSGLQTLRAQQGKGGLPGAPYSAIAPPPRPSDEPPADNENVQSLLDAQQQQANQTETSVTQSAFASSSPQAQK
ncbi:MAG: hypothetical protein WAK26_18580 [Terracidiphilus sp.]